jgi:hypothetical protein
MAYASTKNVEFLKVMQFRPYYGDADENKSAAPHAKLGIRRM